MGVSDTFSDLQTIMAAKAMFEADAEWRRALQRESVSKPPSREGDASVRCLIEIGLKAKGKAR
jgi:hypothetical protein